MRASRKSLLSSTATATNTDRRTRPATIGGLKGNDMNAYSRIVNEYLGYAMEDCRRAIAMTHEPYTESAGSVDDSVREAYKWLMMVESLELVAAETDEDETREERMGGYMVRVYDAAWGLYDTACKAQAEHREAYEMERRVQK